MIDAEEDHDLLLGAGAECGIDSIAGARAAECQSDRSRTPNLPLSRWLRSHGCLDSMQPSAASGGERSMRSAAVGACRARQYHHQRVGEHEMFERLLPQHKRINNADIGFGTTTMSATSNWTVSPIRGGQSRRVIFKPLLSGLLQVQSKLIPGFALGQQGLLVELELCNALDNINGEAANNSVSWDITDARVCYNSITVNS